MPACAWLLSAASHAHSYVVQPHDTLSQIAEREIPHAPYTLYGNDGALSQLLLINPQIKDPHSLVPGQKITLAPHPSPTSQLLGSLDMGERRAPASLADYYSDRYSYLTVSPRGFYTKLDGTDISSNSHALIFSDLSYGIAARWFFVWNEHLKSFLHFDLDHISMLSGSDRTLSGATQNYSSLGAGLEWSMKNLSTGVGIFSKQEIFSLSKSASILSFEKRSIPEFELSSKYAIMPTNPLGLGLRAHTRALLPTTGNDFNTKFGYAYQGALYTEHEFKSTIFGMDLFYGQSSYASNYVKQERSDLGASLNFSFAFGKPAK